MNILPQDRQNQIIAALTEGCSIRAVERLTGVHRDTVMRLGARIGSGCALVHDRLMRGLQGGRVELDEASSYVGKKKRKVTRDDPTDIGDQYIFLAMDAVGKGILSYRVGKRDGENTQAFLRDLRERVIGAPDISSDAFPRRLAALSNSDARTKTSASATFIPPEDDIRVRSDGERLHEARVFADEVGCPRVR